jgi:hypothetical protein
MLHYLLRFMKGSEYRFHALPCFANSYLQRFVKGSKCRFITLRFTIVQGIALQCSQRGLIVGLWFTILRYLLRFAKAGSKCRFYALKQCQGITLHPGSLNTGYTLCHASLSTVHCQSVWMHLRSHTLQYCQGTMFHQWV